MVIFEEDEEEREGRKKTSQNDLNTLNYESCETGVLNSVQIITEVINL